MNIQDWFPSELLVWTPCSARNARVFSNTTVQKHQFLSVQPSLCYNSHIHTRFLKKLFFTRWTFVSKVMSLLFNMLSRLLIEFCQENTLVIANILFQKHKRRLHMDITRWSTLKSDWLYSLQPKMEKLYIVSKNKTGSWLWLGSWTPYCQIQT